MIIQKYLESKGFELIRRGEEFIMNCPFCDDTERKFSMNAITGKWQCFHQNRCGLAGSFADLQKKLGDKPTKLKTSSIKASKKVYTVPTQEHLIMNEDEKLVFDYLVGRGFTAETMRHFKLGSSNRTVIFPFYKNGKLVNRKYRNILDKSLMSQDKNPEPTLFNRDNISSDTLIITEGEFDAMALYQYELETVSVPNGCGGMTWIENEWDFLETFKTIIICFDNDSAGQNSAVEIAHKLGLWRCRIATLPFKDANECLCKGVLREVVWEAINNSRVISPETIVSPMEFHDDVQFLFEQGSRLYGISTAWPELTNILKGWREGEVTVWTGRNSSGKSTILNQHFIDMAGKGEKVCIYSGEMPPDRYLRWALIQASKNEKPTKEDVSRILNWMDGRIYILNVTGTIYPEKLLSDFEYAARRFGVKHFIIDSLMKVRLNDADEYNEQKNFMNTLCDFSKKQKSHVHLVVHPRKTMSDRDEPGKVDVKGSSHITDLAHNVIVLYRYDDETKAKMREKGKSVADMKLYVKKNREYGIEGFVNYFFNEETRRFSTLESKL